MIAALLCCLAFAAAPAGFDDHFTGGTLRIDLIHHGNAYAELPLPTPWNQKAFDAGDGARRAQVLDGDLPSSDGLQVIDTVPG